MDSINLIFRVVLSLFFSVKKLRESWTKHVGLILFALITTRSTFLLDGLHVCTFTENVHK